MNFEHQVSASAIKIRIESVRCKNSNEMKKKEGNLLVTDSQLLFFINGEKVS